MKKIKLNLELQSLFPGKVIDICGNNVTIMPCNIGQIAELTRYINGIMPQLKKENITIDNFSEPETIIKIADIVLNKSPEILSIISGIEIESIKQLPLEVGINLLAECIDINIKSKESLEKNFQSLAKSMGQITKVSEQI